MPLSSPRNAVVVVVLTVCLSLLVPRRALASQHKILCLHGGGGSSAEFRASAGMMALQASFPSFEFVFADGGYGAEAGTHLWIRDPPGGKGVATVDPAWAAASIHALDEIVRDQGPFFGILGYSQGSAFVPIYLAHAPAGTFQVAMMFAGYLTTTHSGLLESVTRQSPFSDIPALVWMGEQDLVITNAMTEAQAEKFTSPTVIRSSIGGHSVPSSCDPTYHQVVSFIADHSGINSPLSDTSAPCPNKPGKEGEGEDKSTGAASDKSGEQKSTDTTTYDKSGDKSGEGKATGIVYDKSGNSGWGDKSGYVENGAGSISPATSHGGDGGVALSDGGFTTTANIIIGALAATIVLLSMALGMLLLQFKKQGRVHCGDQKTQEVCHTTYVQKPVDSVV